MNHKRKILKKACGKGGPIDAAKKIGGVVKSKAADAISGALNIPRSLKDAKVKQTLGAVRQARKYDNAPNYDGSGEVTDAFKVRSVRDGLVGEYLNKIKK